MIINASAHRIPLADKSIHAVVTSPPYFGLRRYEGAQDVAWPEGVYAPMVGAPACIGVPAMHSPLGNEPTIEAFIWHLLLVMRELKRVLRDDGCCWVNLGDSFSSGGRTNTGQWEKTSGKHAYRNDLNMRAPVSGGCDDGNLQAIPHRFALAAQADEWTLRNDCVWHKKSAMPESVSGWKFQDEQLRRGSWRHTRSHEYVFQFVKGMGYWSDSEIVKESGKDWGTRNRTNGKYHNEGTGIQPHSGLQGGETSRNPRSVFSPSPAPYSGAHFATFPPDLIRPLILSSVPRRCCPECGQGWAAIVQGLTTGYAPTCQCGREDYKPGIVLDPFVGSGTTLMVARECGVRAIGLDISGKYLEEQASWRGLQIAKPDLSKMPLFQFQQEAA